MPWLSKVRTKQTCAQYYAPHRFGLDLTVPAIMDSPFIREMTALAVSMNRNGYSTPGNDRASFQGPGMGGLASGNLSREENPRQGSKGIWASFEPFSRWPEELENLTWWVHFNPSHFWAILVRDLRFELTRILAGPAQRIKLRPNSPELKTAYERAANAEQHDRILKRAFSSNAQKVSPASYSDADILNFALNLEYLEAGFYAVATYGATLLKPGVITEAETTGLTTGGNMVKNFGAAPRDHRHGSPSE